MLALVSLAVMPLGVALAPTDDGLMVAADARLSLTASDDNLAAGADGQSRGGLFSVPPMRLSFDDLEKHDVAYDRDLRLMLLAEAPETSGAPGFYLGVLPTLSLAKTAAPAALAWADASTYFGVRKSFTFGELSLTAFPLSGDQLRIGYTNQTSWAIGAQKTGAAPGARLEWTGFGGYGFVAAAASPRPMVQRDGTVEEDTAWSLASGLGWRLFAALYADLEAVTAMRGNIDKPELRIPGVEPVQWRTHGGAARLAWADGVALATPVSYSPLDNDLFAFDSLTGAAEPWRGRLAYSAVGTATLLWQDLQDPQDPSAIAWQRALAASVISKVHYGRFGGAILAAYRDLSFILFDVPSTPNYVSFPKAWRIYPEVRAAARGSAAFRAGDVELSAALEAGVRWPAWVKNQPAATGPNPSLSFDNVMLWNSASEIEILDVGDRVRPVPEAKLSLVARFNEWAGAAVEVLERYDRNQRQRVYDMQGSAEVARLQSLPPNRFGLNVLLRARI
ncbi:MAG: hypothetical protein HY903_24220 [Deltaproteobacteria bacterium]|nr:hypothetical protein [Deltaproteobacteria bacterium]